MIHPPQEAEIRTPPASVAGGRWGEGARQLRTSRASNPDRARAPRHGATPADRSLSLALRGRQLDGPRFRRQAPPGPCRAGFFSIGAQPVIELDSVSRSDATEHGARRDRGMRAHGLCVLRFATAGGFGNLDGVITAIRAFVPPPPPPAPLPQRQAEPPFSFHPFSPHIHIHV